MTVLRTLSLLAFALLVIVSRARGQSLGLNLPSSESEEDVLAREVDDPTAILTQLKLQDRPTFEVQTLATSRGSSTVTEFADMQFLDLFVSNWPNPKETGFGWGIGPTFVFPTGRVSKAGKHAWEVGPALGVSYRGIPHLMVGFLFQDPISFAYTNSSATPQSQMQFQPLISYTLGGGWYVKSADSTWTVNWRHGSSTTIPISLGFGRVWKFEGPELNTWVSGEWMAYRQYTNITPMYTVRFGVTLLFPHFQL